MKRLLLILLIVPAVGLALGPSGTHLIFDGINDGVIVGFKPPLNSMSGNYTIEAWINGTAYNNQDRIIDRDKVFSFYLGPNHTFVFRGPVGSPELIAPLNTITSGWHHLAVRCIKIGGLYKATLFYDGDPVAEKTDLSYNLPFVFFSNLIIGNRETLDRPFKGMIDEVRIWNVARTNLEILANLGLPLQGTELGLLAYYKMDEGSGQIVQDAGPYHLDGKLGMLPIADAFDPQWYVPPVPVGYTLLTPNGPGSLTIGKPLTITWAVEPAATEVNILFSIDGGTSWKILASRIVNNGVLHTFVPGFASGTVLFRVAHPDDPAKSDDSDHLLTIVDPGSWQETITKEAEEGLLADRMQVSVDGQAFDCGFIFSKKENVGTDEITFNIAKAGVYVIWCRLRAVGGSANSYYWSVDDGAEKIMDTRKNDTWGWQTLGDRGNRSGYPDAEVDPWHFSFAAGAHKIKFRARETHCRLDQIIITNNLAMTVDVSPTNWLELTSPKGGQKIVRGSSFEITWHSQGIGSQVSIEFSDGRQFLNPVLIAKNTANDGSYLWQVPNTTFTDAFIRISKGEPGNCPADQNHNEFLIVDPQPVIVVQAPNGGEKWFAKTTQTISWLNKDFTANVDVSLSFDDGLTWKSLVKNLANTGQFVYILPDTSADSCRVRVAATATGVPVDESDHAFTIYPEIKVTMPNGGEKWQVAAAQRIGWTTQKYTGKVNVSYSVNNGTSWTVLAENQAAADTIAWLTPNVVSDHCLIKVAGVKDGLPTDQSDAVFALVKSGEPPSGANYALYFDGVNDYVEIDQAPSLNVCASFTIEFWMKTSTPAQKWTRVLEKGSWDEYYVGFYGNSGKMSGALRTSIPGGSAMTTPVGPSTTILVKDKWYHVAATYDGATAKIYIDGVEENSKSTTAAPRSLIYSLILGAKKTKDVTEYHYQGYLDELRIWNVARSKTEIVNNINKTLTGSEANLVAYYPFNEGTGQIAGDKTANGNQGRLGNLTSADDADPAWVLSDRTVASAMESSSTEEEPLTVDSALPENYSLQQNYPNPFNAGTYIVFEVPNQQEAREVILDVFDLNGRLIHRLNHGSASAGRHQVYWNGLDSEGRSVASGVYFYQLRAGQYCETKRMIMLK